MAGGAALAVGLATVIIISIQLYQQRRQLRVLAAQIRADRNAQRATLRRQDAALDLTRRQLQRDQERQSEERLARLRAARVAFPLTLSALQDHAAAVIDLLMASWPRHWDNYPDENHDLDTIVPMPASPPPFPVERIASLERVVEYEADEAVIERIASIVREAQNLDMGLAGLGRHGNVTAARIGRLSLNAAALHARVASLVAYSRGVPGGFMPGELWQDYADTLSALQLVAPELLRMVDEDRAGRRGPGDGD